MKGLIFMTQKIVVVKDTLYTDVISDMQNDDHKN